MKFFKTLRQIVLRHFVKFIFDEMSRYFFWRNGFWPNVQEPNESVSTSCTASMSTESHTFLQPIPKWAPMLQVQLLWKFSSKRRLVSLFSLGISSSSLEVSLFWNTAIIPISVVAIHCFITFSFLGTFGSLANLLFNYVNWRYDVCVTLSKSYFLAGMHSHHSASKIIKTLFIVTAMSIKNYGMIMKCNFLDCEEKVASVRENSLRNLSKCFLSHLK